MTEKKRNPKKNKEDRRRRPEYKDGSRDDGARVRTTTGYRSKPLRSKYKR